MRRMVAVLIMSLLSASVARAQRTDISRVYPIYNNNGKPDLTLDFKQLTSQMQIVDRLFEPGSCELVEQTPPSIQYGNVERW
jgi:hypothetical protein